MIGDDVNIFPLLQAFDESVKAKLKCAEFVVVEGYSHNVEVF